MSAESPIHVRSWPVGNFTATLSVPRTRRSSQGHACIEWARYVPQRLTDAEIEQYRPGRNKALAELAHMMGGNVAVIDLRGDTA